MKVIGVAFACCLALAVQGAALEDRVRELEAAGDAQGARTLLEETVQREPHNGEALALYAGFLDRHGKRLTHGCSRCSPRARTSNSGPNAPAGW